MTGRRNVVTVRARILAGIAVLALTACGGNPPAAAMPDAVQTAADTIDTTDTTLSEPGPGAAMARHAAAPAVDADVHAQVLEHWGRRYEAAMLMHLEALADTGDAHADLALALMLPWSPEEDAAPPAPGEVPEWARIRAEAIQDAARRLPDDAPIAWMEAEQCPPGVPGCDPVAALARLQRLEPDNAAGWLLALEQAFRRDDQAAVEHYLARAAASRRYDPHYLDLAAMLLETTAEVPLPPLDAQARQAMGLALGLRRPVSDQELRLVPVMGMAVAQALPARQGLSEHCRAPSASRTRDCAAVMTLFAGSQTLLERMMGLTAMVRMSADRPDGARWREQLRRTYWMFGLAPDAPATPGYLDALIHRGEIAALEHHMRIKGLTGPPAGWLPRNPRHRALVTTGREPGG